jgi:hypothetical protein
MIIIIIGGGDMSISRRSFVFGSVAASVFISLWDINPSKAEVKVGDNATDKKLIIKMVRDVYPHDRFPESPYERTANDVITKGNADSAKKAMLSEGIENLKKAKYEKLNFKKSTKYLKKIEKSDFFQHVRGTSVVTLYNDQEVWGLLGYEGSSFEKGGYVNRGFNDLDWLPEPRIEEHPELAAFLKEDPKRLAAIKDMIKLN